MRLTHKMLCIMKQTVFIKNMDLPLCINCINFIEDKMTDPYGPLQNDNENGKCKLYGEKNIVTGEIKYDYASDCRKDKRCGLIGNYFTSFLI